MYGAMTAKALAYGERYADLAGMRGNVDLLMQHYLNAGRFEGRQFATGGAYPGGLALVGEQGPELINFNSPGWISTAAQTQQIINDLQANARAGFSANTPTVIAPSFKIDTTAQNEELKKQTDELKEQNKRLTEELAVQREGFNQMIAELKNSSAKLDQLESEIRKAAA
jgi:hypothetical protein